MPKLTLDRLEIEIPAAATLLQLCDALKESQNG
jgi:hypothetical protein